MTHDRNASCASAAPAQSITTSNGVPVLKGTIVWCHSSSVAINVASATAATDQASLQPHRVPRTARKSSAPRRPYAKTCAVLRNRNWIGSNAGLAGGKIH